jgi:hypothetical protein
MADLDSSVPLKRIGTTALLIEDGTTPTANSVSVIFEGTFSATVTGRAVVEATSQGRHKSTPVLVETTSGTVALTLDGHITSLKGNSNTHIYEALTRTGTASSWATTGDGDAYMLKITATFVQSKQTTPATQTLVFAYCHPDSIQIGAGPDDAVTFSASFTDYEDYPTAA